MPRVLANGIEQAYEVIGAGPPMIMLHGATSSGREDFAAQLPLFSRAFMCHTPDARGHGGSRWDATEGLSTEMLVADVEAYADVLGLDTFHLLGFSMGAMTALQFAVRHPERVRTLVVIGISTEREPRASVARRLMDPAKIERDDPAWAAALAERHDPGQGEGAWRHLVPAIAADVASQALLSPRDLRRVEAPALVACGDRDPFCPVEHAAGLARQLMDGRLLVAPGCGHELTVARPGLFNDACGHFYRSTERLVRDRAEAPVRVRRGGTVSSVHATMAAEGAEPAWPEGG